VKAIWLRLHLSFYIILFSKNWINPFLTLYINLAFLPLRQSIKLPIWIYGKTKFINLSGKFIIDTNNVYSGMITIGKTNESPCASGTGTEIINRSKITFKGPTEIGSGCRFLIYGKGELVLGKNLRMNNQIAIGCCNLIVIGNTVSIAHQTQIFDTDFHFMYNLMTKMTKTNNKPIFIGNNCWIGNRVSIMKGTEIPDYTIVGSNTLLNKQYDIPEGTILAGIPAKVIASGYTRIRNRELEENLNTYFKSGELTYQFPEETKLEDLINNDNLK
jgi:acetyltransferase-like isoleucine patch superfamily enzyme